MALLGEKRYPEYSWRIFPTSSLVTSLRCFCTATKNSSGVDWSFVIGRTLARSHPIGIATVAARSCTKGLILREHIQ